MSYRVFECVSCGHEWKEPECTDGGKHGYEIACPKCGGMQKMRIEADGTKTGCGGQHGSHGCCSGHGHS